MAARPLPRGLSSDEVGAADAAGSADEVGPADALLLLTAHPDSLDTVLVSAARIACRRAALPRGFGGCES